MDFRWMEYMYSLFGDDKQTIEAVNQAIWRHGTWVSMDEGADEVTAIEKAVSLVPSHEKYCLTNFLERHEQRRTICDYY